LFYAYQIRSDSLQLIVM